MISSKNIAIAVKQSLDSEKDVGDFALRLLDFLKENHLIHLLPNIIQKLEFESKKEKDFKTILIKTSHEFNEVILEKIKEKFGKEKGDTFLVEVDESLIGGFVALGKNRVINASVKRNIMFLRESLTK
jgi:F0F1-type ATP synthase delta subunit